MIRDGNASGRWTLVPIFLAAFGLAACDQSGLHGASSMRIEVEVYKGPLSKTIEVQEAELTGKVFDSRRALVSMAKEIDISMCRLGCFDFSATVPVTEEMKKQELGEEYTASLPFADLLAESKKGQNDKKKKAAMKKGEHVKTGDEDVENEYVVVKRQRTFEPYYRYTLRRNDAPPACEDWPEGVKSRTSPDSEYKICPILGDLREDALLLAKESCDLLGGAALEGSWGYDCTETKDPKARGPYGQLKDAKIGKPFGVVSGADTEIAKDIALYGQKLRTRASFWAVDHTAIEPDGQRVRIDMANFAQNAAEYGNQITARADALIWQLRKRDADERNFSGSSRGKNAYGSPGTDVAKRLALSLYLRDSSTTDYLNLYDWNNAAVEDSPSGQTPTDRVRLVERLVNDTYWSKINTVYASGQGEVSMAFIKDDIGNWDLKNFANDPSELLAAYHNAVRGTVEAAASLASGTQGIGGAQDLLALASQLSTGQSPAHSAFGQMNIGRLHARALGKLKAQRELLDKQSKDLQKELAEAKTGSTKLQKQIQDAADTRKTKQTELDTVEAKLTTPAGEEDKAELLKRQGELKDEIEALDQKIPEFISKKALGEEGIAKTQATIDGLGKQAVAEARAILEDHAAVIEALQDTVSTANGSGKHDLSISSAVSAPGDSKPPDPGATRLPVD